MVPRENKNNAYANFGGTNKEYYGIFRSGLLTAGHRAQVTDHRSQVPGPRSQVAGRRSQVAGRRSQVAGRSSQVTENLTKKLDI